MDRTAEMAGLLDIALRGRIQTVVDLAEVTGATVETTQRQLARLEELGLLSLDDGAVTYRRPDASITDLASRILAGVVGELAATIDETQGILRTLPALLQAWEHGNTYAHGLPIDVLHGSFAAADMFRLQASRAKPRASYACMPDTTPLYTVLRAKGPGSYWDEHAQPDHDIRLIVSVADANTELGRTQLAHEINAGSQVRMHPDPPSFFWILDHASIGIPFTWGEAWPSSIMSIQSPALAELLTWIYHRVWDEATPVTGHNHTWQHPWDPILHLMKSGMTMESASTSLGLTARTGRRRVADAMRHYGATSHFSLGAAWNAARTRTHDLNHPR
ncbi:hypothetical protein [Dietzia natronolimnaea]|uniref:hypothetical protein n=1 Tax=Dietzia natronolimnaea TaxID=161920 RepID=UPI0015FE7E95|nr:hypothetical protein [Dietzia natronolimnaea]MBB1037937.1 hypothetical protein [Dietzia natronolimnaea]